MADINVENLKKSWATVASHGADPVAHWFYAHLFVHHPEVRSLFAPSMTQQRDRLVGALANIVSNVDKVDELVPYLQDLGRDHRKFGAVADHYPAVGASLIATLKYFSGTEWTPELEADWAAAYGLVAKVMSDAATEADAGTPAYWDAEVIDIEQRTFDIAVLWLRTAEPIPYRAGQSCSIEASMRRPRLWRWYTPANPPGSDKIEIHVRLVAGGPVSTALVRSSSKGDALRIGQPMGELALDENSDRPLLLLAGGTGLAPMKAIIGQLAASGARRPTALYFGTRTVREMYDAPALATLEAEHDWLDVTMVASDDITWQGPKGLVAQVALAAQDWTGHDVYVCGSPAMVNGTLDMISDHGVPSEQVRYDAFIES